MLILKDITRISHSEIEIFIEFNNRPILFYGTWDYTVGCYRWNFGNLAQDKVDELDASFEFGRFISYTLEYRNFPNAGDAIFPREFPALVQKSLTEHAKALFKKSKQFFRAKGVESDESDIRSDRPK